MLQRLFSFFTPVAAAVLSAACDIPLQTYRHLITSISTRLHFLVQSKASPTGTRKNLNLHRSSSSSSSTEYLVAAAADCRLSSWAKGHKKTLQNTALSINSLWFVWPRPLSPTVISCIHLSQLLAAVERERRGLFQRRVLSRLYGQVVCTTSWNIEPRQHHNIPHLCGPSSKRTQQRAAASIVSSSKHQTSGIETLTHTGEAAGRPEIGEGCDST